MTNKTTFPVKIGFIGGGNMAQALIGGILDPQNQSICEGKDILVMDINQASLDHLEQQYGVQTCTEINQNFALLDVVLMSVKPQQMREVAQQLAPYLNHALIISIAAGIRIADLSNWLGNYNRIVRTMPNMAAMIRLGMTGLFATDDVSAGQREVATAIMSAVGDTLWVDTEALLDPLTAVSGSGPAYVFYFIEAMQAAAQQLGFTEQQALTLTMQTFRGAVALASQSNEPVATLRERVTSKGGTTYAALTSMADDQVAQLIGKALHAASERSKALGEGKK